MPPWLSLDPETGALTGTPTADHVGLTKVEIIAWQSQSRFATQVFTIQVANANDAPSVGYYVGNEQVVVEEAFSWTIPEGAFYDQDVGDRLSYSISGVDGESLPAWLKLDLVTAKITGTPSISDVGTYQLQVTARDTSGATAVQIFTVEVSEPLPTFVTGTDGDDNLVGTPFVNDSRVSRAATRWMVARVTISTYLNLDSAKTLLLTRTPQQGTRTGFASVPALKCKT